VAWRCFLSRTDASSFGWVYCGSHNFSAAAWGRLISNPFGLKSKEPGKTNTSLSSWLLWTWDHFHLPSNRDKGHRQQRLCKPGWHYFAICCVSSEVWTSRSTSNSKNYERGFSCTNWARERQTHIRGNDRRDSRWRGGSSRGDLLCCRGESLCSDAMEPGWFISELLISNPDA